MNFLHFAFDLPLERPQLAIEFVDLELVGVHLLFGSTLFLEREALGFLLELEVINCVLLDLLLQSLYLHLVLLELSLGLASLVLLVH